MFTIILGNNDKEFSRVIPNDNVNYVDRVYSEVDQGEEEDNE